MKLTCGIKTIKGVIAVGSLGTGLIVATRLLQFTGTFNLYCRSDNSKCIIALIAGFGAWPLLVFLYVLIRQLLIYCFPVACGHRRCVFTGRSSKPLREILLSVDDEIPTERQFHEFRDKALLYLNDIKIPLEKAMTRTTFRFIFSGSAVERFGIPFMMSENRKNSSRCCKAVSTIDALYTDLDVMFCSSVDKASFIGHGNILIEPLVTDGVGFMGYAKLTSLTPAGCKGKSVSSKLIRDQAKDAVGYASVSHLPGHPCRNCCCCGVTEVNQGIKLNSKGPAIKINIPNLFEADITICIQCSEWPFMSDWPFRPRYWPSVDEAQRIMSLGCHLVAKPAPTEKNKATWRFSFSLAEVELSKLVPDTARKCFLALKIILKDHLQPVVPGISSYQIKTIFFNTLEKVPVGFWAEDNIEECFLTLLAEVRDALLSMNCSHHWFSSINLFDLQANDMQRLAKKVERIMKDPAPFIFDDGCCCLSPCCVRVPDYNFTSRSRDQFLADYDEVTITADGHMMVATGSQGCQLPVSQSRRSSPEDQIDPSTYSAENHGSGITEGFEQLVVSLPPLQTAVQELSSRPSEAEDDWRRNALPLLVILPPEQNA